VSGESNRAVSGESNRAVSGESNRAVSGESSGAVTGAVTHDVGADAERGPAAPTDPPPRALAAVAGFGLFLVLGTIGFAYRHLQLWDATRRGLSPVEQRVSLLGVPFFKRSFLEFVERLALTVPDGEGILLEPETLIGPRGVRTWDVRGQGRWNLYLNYYAYPRRIYARAAELSSGTLVDYPRWLEHHFVTLRGPDAEALAAADEAALEARGIRWRLRYPASQRFVLDTVVLERRTEGGWEPVPLEPLPPDSPLHAGRGLADETEADETDGADPATERGA
jgi:hypothetical protein